MVARARRFCTGNAFQVPVSSCSSIIESAPELDSELERRRRRTQYATAPEQGRWAKTSFPSTAQALVPDVFQQCQ